jgi:hypothetical protein
MAEAAMRTPRRFTLALVLVSGVALMLPLSAQAPPPPRVIAVPAARGAGAYIVPGDYDGDRRVDAAVKGDDGVWRIDVAANGFGSWDQFVPGGGGATSAAAAADYEGDGRAGLSIRTAAQVWWIDHASNGLGLWDAQHAVTDTSPPLPADYDGDGRADLAVRIWAIFTAPQPSAPSPAFWAIDYAVNGFGAWDASIVMIVDDTIPVPADYDGDGRADLADKSSAGVWRIDYASNGFGAWDVVLGGYGGTDAHPVPADYDGDRRADLSVKADNGNWYIDYASNGFGVWNAIYGGYGWADAIPVPADYDGDGRADLAIRKDDGVWHVDYRSNGFGAWDHIWDPDSGGSPGAVSNPTGRPIGGGEGYGDWVTGGSVVSTALELRAALASATPGVVVYVRDDAVIDLDELDVSESLPLGVPAGVTLASGRGRNGSLGALLHSDNQWTRPIFKVLGSRARITGLRLRGPDTEVTPPDCGLTPSWGIDVRRDADDTQPFHGVRIDNNEMWGWPRAAVDILNVFGVTVQHNHLHHNRRQVKRSGCRAYGLGYGVVVGRGAALIEANLFDHNRHDIASDGAPGARYEARHNLVLNGAVQHSFDVHGGADRKDGTDIAGTLVHVHHNTFLQSKKPAFKIRGVPELAAYVWRNEFRHTYVSSAIQQTNAEGNLVQWSNPTSVNHFPAWFVSFSGESFWRWRRFDGLAISAARFGDFDGDGAADAFATRDGEWIVSDGARHDWRAVNTSSVATGSLRFGDFDGDGRTDVFRKGSGGWFVSWGAVTPWTRINTLPGALSALAFADFDGDGATDVFTADGATWRVSWRGTSPWVALNTSSFTTASLRFADFDGDGRADVFRTDGVAWRVSWGGTGPWARLNTSAITVGSLGFGDFDGDGRTDVLYGNGTTWSVSWGGAGPWVHLNTSSLKASSLAFADVNGDGRTDVLSRQSP